MKILPDEIPETTAPLVEGEYVPAPQLPSNSFKQHDNKNVFVTFKNRKTAVGRLSCQEKFFFVGTSDEIHYYDDIESFREV